MHVGDRFAAGIRTAHACFGTNTAMLVLIRMHAAFLAAGAAGLLANLDHRPHHIRVPAGAPRSNRPRRRADIRAVEV